MQGTFAALFPEACRVSAKGTYTVRDDVLTLRTTGFSMFDSHGQSVILPIGLEMDTDETHPSLTVCRFQVRADRLTLDRLDGTPPSVLTRQRLSGEEAHS